MVSTIVSLIAIAAGIYFIRNRKKHARESMDFQNRVFKFHFGEKEVKSSEFVITVCGCGFIVIGFLELVGVIEWRGL